MLYSPKSESSLAYIELSKEVLRLNVKKISRDKIESLDKSFSTQEERQEVALKKIIFMPISDIHEFNDHPFKVRMDMDISINT